MPNHHVSQLPDERTRSFAHPRTLGWVRTTALAMGGSNQSLFLLGALLIAQGTAAMPLLVVGLVLAWWPCRAGSS